MEGNNFRREGPREINKGPREMNKDSRQIRKGSRDLDNKPNNNRPTANKPTNKPNNKPSATATNKPSATNKPAATKPINRGDDSPDRKKDPESKEKITVVGVRFDLTGKTYHYLPNNLELRRGDYCIVEVDKGEEIVRVFRPASAIIKKPGRKPFRKVLRLATPRDLERVKRNEEMGRKAQVACQKKIVERSLPMKLIRVKYSFDGSKAVFYFTAEGRIDFRDLVRDLASRFKTRIEMRQIGVRDEARMISGFGCCGRQLCCSLFFMDFEPVSIRMAKDQCLTLNPGKISGICGRLMCCLVYEAATYEEIRKKLPRLGERVMLNNEEGKVVSFDILKGLVCVEFPDGRAMRVNGSEVKRIKGSRPSKKPPKPGSGKAGR